MDSQTLKVLIDKLSPLCGRALEAAAGFANSRGHREIVPEHLLLKLLEESEVKGEASHLSCVLSYFSVDQNTLWQQLVDNVNQQRVLHDSKAVLSSELYELLERACLNFTLRTPSKASWVRQSDTVGIDSLSILESFIQISSNWPHYRSYDALRSINLDILKANVSEITVRSNEYEVDHFDQSISNSNDVGNVSLTEHGQGLGSGSAHSPRAIDRFTTDLTIKAKNGELDPISGRHKEIRKAIDILCRRRKNNPILVGEPGVGKTAVVEGLAQRIVDGDVPEFLKGKHIHVLDLGLLQAGASVKGEFEKRLKQVIDEVGSSDEIMLFIDEAHTLVGAGGEAGLADAANLLKPALARGELRTVAATTWSEYKQYFERDPALARRFQMVKVEEPTLDAAKHMLTQIKEKYEQHHDVSITDEAIEAAVELSDRYVSGRFLPDKAIDLIDTAAARVKMGQAVVPQTLEGLQAKALYIEDRIAGLEKELDQGLESNMDLHHELKDEQQQVLLEISDLKESWDKQNHLVEEIQRSVENAENDEESKHRAYSLRKLLQEEQESSSAGLCIQAEVNATSIADVIADWTGIPVGSMVRDDLQNLLTFDAALGEDIIGQDGAIRAIGQSLRANKAKLRFTEGPQGVFLLAGPSGVGKTETAKKIAKHLFGSERSLITINMSEYQEAHTVSQLKGSPPGYVGYGQGGLLTEAVRQKPYSVVLLDEVEKAHVDVMNVFYQVFDQGIMRDGEGREIDFKNTIILMTSNLGSELIMEAMSDRNENSESDDVDLSFSENETLKSDDSVANSAITDVSGGGNERDSSDDDKGENDDGKIEYTPPSTLELEALIQPTVAQHFAPALAARMQIVPFVSLNEESLKAIVTHKLDKLAERLMSEYKMELRCDESALDMLLSLCQESHAGARLINQRIESLLSSRIANEILHYLVESDLPDILQMTASENGTIDVVFLDKQAGGQQNALLDDSIEA
ncbi:type VI secretion system ATPase TssH [Marinomonas mediterranea]|uniref:type VI secretion system ATPase TssH n=1 Tax=Marinomonas mediterranea TaxID=119864 RepID=UPI00234B574C|nr:type VI secretion system ATPase TssH [Marinomonas mediterranea]WCN14867.1 type VI secretion system ATPase TssH [Marinomonas mediterranea]